MSWLKGKKDGCLARNPKIIKTRQLNLNQNTEVTLVVLFLFAEGLAKTSINAALSSLNCIKCVVFMVSSHTG